MIFKNLKELVFQEPQDKNESFKVAVVLRMSCLISIMYLFFLMIVTIIGGTVMSDVMQMQVGSGIAFSLFFMVMYTYILYGTYHDQMKASLVLFNLSSLLWIAILYVCFGSDIGIQHFFFALILVDLLLGRKNALWQVSAIYALRFVLYLNDIYNQSLWEVPELLEECLHISSLVFEAAIVLFSGIYFTKDAFAMESRLQEYNRELKKAASTDPLTKLWNRFQMLEHAQWCVKQYNKGSMRFMSVAIGDIDFFKSVNDTYGHECGDEVLKSLAALFAKKFKEIGAVARWGGEEFLFLFEDMNGDDAFTSLVDIQNKINQTEITYGDQVLRVHMTFGLSEYDFNKTMDDNIRIADDKLYQGKETGRNRIVY